MLFKCSGKYIEIYYSFKITFLLALASAERVEELHCISCNMFSEDLNLCHFSFIPEIVANLRFYPFDFMHIFTNYCQL